MLAWRDLYGTGSIKEKEFKKKLNSGQLARSSTAEARLSGSKSLSVSVLRSAFDPGLILVENHLKLAFT